MSKKMELGFCLHCGADSFRANDRYCEEHLFDLAKDFARVYELSENGIAIDDKTSKEYKNLHEYAKDLHMQYYGLHNARFINTLLDDILKDPNGIDAVDVLTAHVRFLAYPLITGKYSDLIYTCFDKMKQIWNYANLSKEEIDWLIKKTAKCKPLSFQIELFSIGEADGLIPPKNGDSEDSKVSESEETEKKEEVQETKGMTKNRTG